jgi:hypothetical protein
MAVSVLSLVGTMLSLLFNCFTGMEIDEQTEELDILKGLQFFPNLSNRAFLGMEEGFGWKRGVAGAGLETEGAGGGLPIVGIAAGA